MSYDRHVIVYKKGHEPVEEEAVGAAVTRVGTRPKKKAAAVRAPAPPTNFVKVHTVKRDRRSIEDYQLEKAKKKKLEGEEAKKEE
mmetsp:Transcript_9157/g.17136  ORF Transcript_9157/g.17136 Transcript_9157/m.17136 type:complete len:85 (-) Transcript_9157:1153-1407(-)